MSPLTPELLDDAIERGTVVVLSLPSAGMIRHHKSRFLSGTEGGIWVEGVVAEWPLLTALWQDHDPVGISFKAGQHRANFLVPVLALEPAFRLNADVPVAALLVERPSVVKAVQRRHHYRVPVHPGEGLTARLWRIGDRDPLAQEPKPGREFAAVVHDLSVGGIGVVVDWNDPTRVPYRETDRFRVEIVFQGGPPMLIAARPGKPRPASTTGRYEIGLGFTDLQDDLAGRQTLGELQRIVNALELLEVRRTRG